MAILKSPSEGVMTPQGLVKPYPFFAQPLKAPTTTSSEQDLVNQLRETVVVPAAGDYKQPQVLGRNDDGFVASSTIFNGAVKTNALALVKPITAQDVSRTIIFCREHDIELSVKGGGNGVHGWSVAGHIILDLSLMTEVTISLPDPTAPTLQESFERLRLQRRDSERSSATEEPRRPSLASTHAGSADTGSKRSASDDFATDGTDDDGARRKGKVDGDRSGPYSPLDRIDEVTSGRDDSRASSVMDQDHNRSGSGSGSGSNSGSGTRSGSASRSDSYGVTGKDSTPATSISGTSEFTRSPKSPIEDGYILPGPSRSSFSSSVSSTTSPEAGPSSRPGPRITYVNPSQTPTSSFPFVSTSFGANSNTSASYSTSFHPSFASGPSSTQSTLNTHPDPPPYTLVTFGAGVNSKALDAATAASPYGAFHVPTSAFPVGAGQFISGGFGFIGRKHGLAMDNIVEVEMVLADGRIVWVGQDGKKGGDWKEDEDPKEVWWAVRGAGAIIGVVTRFRAKAYYLPSVYAGNLIYLFDREKTPSLLRHVRDCIKGSPRTLYTNIIMTAGPPGAPAIVIFQLCFSGARAEGEMYVQAISAWEGGRSLFQDFSERKFERQQLAVEEILKGGAGRKWFIKSDMLLSLSDEVIDETCSRFHSVPDGCTWLFEYTGGGAIADVKDSCYPSSHRESAFTVAALHQWSHNESPVDDTRCVTTAEEWINEVIHPNSPGGPLPCFLQSSLSSSVSAVYGESFPRLRSLKKKLDPSNFFCHAMWPQTEFEEDGIDGLGQDIKEGRIEGMQRGDVDEDGFMDEGDLQKRRKDDLDGLTAGIDKGKGKAL
ncbi:hypothetical protein I302_106821 [Kwoniella bestiolae CBS 10118]|uniref:FAD-binding PCMH-type domain-containing protein n=1 Tax=Kwoniella bestiolae CBS 10118 TaxID=1296100 RepID=A0A1B9G0A7_9TREE|nr:hypothetical protein I302_05913 [Kwoniella bestiolae CBS 10118]OCF24453.1 hypothetical protein I302_05913 [Kwoniella bestiolae CBS 10118]